MGEVPREMFNKRVRTAFEFLESAVAAAKIHFYGLATWNAFRETETAQDYLQLEAMESFAQDMLPTARTIFASCNCRATWG